MAIELEGLFRSLVMPLPGVSGVELAAIEIPATAGYRLAKDKDGHACLLVEQAGPPGGEPELLVEAWHRDPAELYDFSEGRQRIEVKSSSMRRREHYFSLDQLVAPANTRLVIASVFVSGAGGGTSLGSLFAETRERLANNATVQAHLDATFYGSLGSA